MLMKLCGLRLNMVTRKFLHSSLTMNFCDIVAILLVRCIPPCEMMMLNFVTWCMWIMWISVNLDAGSNFCEFGHILAGSRMQPLMAAKSWLVLAVQNRAQVHRKPTGDLVPFSPRRVLPRFVNPRIGRKLLGFSI
jgi:hypothetical protein